MSGLDPSQLEALVDPHDREYVASIADPQLQATVFASLVQHRRPDQLAVGDSVPALALTRLEQTGTVRLDEFVGVRPLVLIFGSYT